MDIAKTRNMAGVIRDSLLSLDLDADTAEMIAFHLSDCVTDFQDILGIYERGSEMDNESVNSIVFRFLAHVPDHMTAARVLAGFEDDGEDDE